jgi:hypothetical protein
MQLNMERLTDSEVIGFVRPSVDAHTLGSSYAAKLLTEAGYRVVVSDKRIADAVNQITKPGAVSILSEWIRAEKITRLGLSYRLDPDDAVEVFGRLHHHLKDRRIYGASGSPLRRLYFAGLPAACARIEASYGDEVPVFRGDETPSETLTKLGVPALRIPLSISSLSTYDERRLDFGRELVATEGYRKILAEDRSGFSSFGTRREHLVDRLDYASARGQSPLMRVHVGPYQPDRAQALQQFQFWLRELSSAGLLDIVSVGTSQLTQEAFGENWAGRPNGGGVPVNSESEYQDIWEAARPMLVRTYAGTRHIPRLAEIHERSLNIAWHALSFWWFSQIDGRGPNSVRENLREHLETLKFIAATGKPFEPNIPHHFAFRGSDDVTYVTVAFLAALVAKRQGVRFFVLQNMLNTPKYTAGVQDLAKARALLELIRGLEDASFRVIYQPRAGLDYFSPDLEKAKAQLAAVTALMDDVEPGNQRSPDIIHVVSYCEAVHLADPQHINESIQITRAALESYRGLKKAGRIPDMSEDAEVVERTRHLVSESRKLLAGIEAMIPDALSVEGLYAILQSGFFAVPYLWECRTEFRKAVEWTTDIVDGGVNVVDHTGKTIDVSERLELIRAHTQVGNLGSELFGESLV